MVVIQILFKVGFSHTCIILSAIKVLLSASWGTNKAENVFLSLTHTAGSLGASVCRGSTSHNRLWFSVFLLQFLVPDLPPTHPLKACMFFTFDTSPLRGHVFLFWLFLLVVCFSHLFFCDVLLQLVCYMNKSEAVWFGLGWQQLPYMYLSLIFCCYFVSYFTGCGPVCPAYSSLYC